MKSSLCAALGLGLFPNGEDLLIFVLIGIMHIDPRVLLDCVGHDIVCLEIIYDINPHIEIYGE